MGSNINVAHVNGRHPTRGLGQEVIYRMTCITLSNPEDMKHLLRDAIKVITPFELEEDEYAVLKFCLVPEEPGTIGTYLLMGLSPAHDTTCACGTYFRSSYTLQPTRPRAPRPSTPLPSCRTLREFR
jgi:hypothetical protein